MDDNRLVFSSVIDESSSLPQILNNGSTLRTDISKEEFTQAINLTADKIKSGETILGVTGTYSGGGAVDYTNNNFELVGNTLKIKKYFGKKGPTDLSEFELPPEIAYVVQSVKNKCIISYYCAGVSQQATRYVNLYIFVPADNTQLEVWARPVSSYTPAEQEWSITDYTGPMLIGVNASGETSNANSDLKFDRYSLQYKITADGMTLDSNSNSKYGNYNFDDGGIDLGVVTGTDALNENLLFGDYFKWYNYEDRSETISGKNIIYKEILQPIKISNTYLNDISDVNVTIPTGSEYSSFTVENPNGLGEYTELSGTASLDGPFKAFVKYYEDTTSNKYVGLIFCATSTICTNRRIDYTVVDSSGSESYDYSIYGSSMTLLYNGETKLTGVTVYGGQYTQKLNIANTSDMDNLLLEVQESVNCSYTMYP